MKGEKKLREVMKAKCIEQEDRVELQDIIGRRSFAEIKEWYSELETKEDRRMFLWVAFSVMDADTAMDIFTEAFAQDHIERLVNKESERLDGEWRKLGAKERIFDEGKRTMHRRLRDIRKRKLAAERKSDGHFQRLQGALGRVRDRNDKIEQLKDVIADLEDELGEYRIVKKAFAILGRI